VAVEVEAMHYDDMRGPTLASLRADEPELDLVILDNPWVDGLVGAGQLEPLDERIAGTPGVDWDGYYPTLRPAAEIGGRIWGVPFYTWTPGLVYRRDLWETAGLSAPGSLDELAAAAKALTTPERAGMAMQPRAGYDLCEEFGSWLFAANARDKETAWAFISWIAANERERVARGGAPVSSGALTDPGAWADGLDPAAYYHPFDALHAGARPLVVGPNAEDVIVAVGEELHPAVAGSISVDEAVTRAARRAEALLAG
jgi:ABC-type glycerol-3-phosphate transport system substrate-binding protein